MVHVKGLAAGAILAAVGFLASAACPQPATAQANEPVSSPRELAPYVEAARSIALGGPATDVVKGVPAGLFEYREPENDDPITNLAGNALEGARTFYFADRQGRLMTLTVQCWEGRVASVSLQGFLGEPAGGEPERSAIMAAFGVPDRGTERDEGGTIRWSAGADAISLDLPPAQPSYHYQRQRPDASAAYRAWYDRGFRASRDLDETR